MICANKMTVQLCELVLTFPHVRMWLWSLWAIMIPMETIEVNPFTRLTVYPLKLIGKLNQVWIGPLVIDNATYYNGEASWKAASLEVPGNILHNILYMILKRILNTTTVEWFYGQGRFPPPAFIHIPQRCDENAADETWLSVTQWDSSWRM